MEDGKEVTVALVLKFPSGHKALVPPTKAEIYKEVDTTRPNQRCLRVPGIIDTTQTQGNGVQCLLSWVENYVESAIVYSDTPGVVQAGVESIGLTGDTNNIWTKSIVAFAADPLAPFTVDGLRKAGLV